MKKEDFEKAVGSLQGALGVLPGEPILSSPIKLHVPIVRGDLTEARPTLKDAKSELEEQVEAEGQQQNVEIIESVVRDCSAEYVRRVELAAPLQRCTGGER